MHLGGILITRLSIMANPVQQNAITVMVDGVFDCTHFGHANCLRQARIFGHKVLAAIHPDSEVGKHKHCLPVFLEDERYELLRSMKFLDGTIEGMRYDFTLANLDAHGIDYVAHGNDPVIGSDGSILYEDIRLAGRYRLFPRTGGVCTTDTIAAILERGLNPVAMVPIHQPMLFTDFHDLIRAHQRYLSGAKTPSSLIDDTGKDEPTSEISTYSPGPIIYTQGDFELFSIGHLKFLKKCAECGGNLIVGITSDESLQIRKGRDRPLANCIERALNVLSYRCVHAIVFLDPITESNPSQLIKKLGASRVLIGSISSLPKWFVALRDSNQALVTSVVESGSSVRSTTIIGRILKRNNAFTERNEKKKSVTMRRNQR